MTSVREKSHKYAVKINITGGRYVTKQEIYEQIVRLTSELHATNVAEKFFGAAKEGDSKRVEEVFETFKKENLDFYLKVLNFGVAVRTISYGKPIDVFSSEEDKENGSYVFDNDTINAVTFYALMLLGGMDEFYLFNWGTESSENFVKAIEDAGYEKLANFVDNWSVYDYVGSSEKYQTIYDCLVGIFEGDI